ncbi:MAG: DNA polymerase IV [Halanaerobiales bacterium]|nr:DNA polymerase IV [Halanaerobiales bacterium]
MKNELNIIHVDMDAYFASVEQLDNPKLRGKAVIIGGVNLDNRGVVSTASYEARKFGVHSAMPIARAKKLCPHGIYLPGRHSRYQELSKQIFNVFLEFTPRVEKLSIDEAFLNVKGCHRLHGGSRKIAEQIKKRVLNKVGLVCSVGVAGNKFLAKIASDLDKPDGLVIIKDEDIKDILDPLSIKKIPGIGEITAQKLNQIGIYKIKELKSLNLAELIEIFGKQGRSLYNLIRGQDKRQVSINQQVKSISNENTFPHDVIDSELLLKYLLELCQKVTRRLRKQKFIANIVFIKVKDNSFHLTTRRITLNEYIDSTDDLYKHSKILLKDINIKKPIRLIGVGVAGFKEKRNEQLSLFNTKNKEIDFNLTIDSIKDKFGNKSIRRARDLLKKEENEKK